MKYELRHYSCGICGHTDMKGTNHIGNTWGKCKSCSADMTQFICVEPEATAYRESIPKIKTVITPYRFDFDIDGHEQEYKKLHKELSEKSKGLFFELARMAWQGSVVKQAIKVFSPKSNILLMADFSPGGQWNTDQGMRVHDWHENEYPNKRIKAGYYLEVTQEMKNLCKASGSNYYGVW